LTKIYIKDIHVSIPSKYSEWLKRCCYKFYIWKI